MDSSSTRQTLALDAAWQRRRTLYIACARRLANEPELYHHVREFLRRAITSDSETRKANALEWQAMLAGHDAMSASQMLLGWLVPDPGRGCKGGELDRILSNCPLVAIADDQIRTNAGLAPDKHPVRA